MSVIEGIADFQVAGPELVERRSLQQRIDRKFLIGGAALSSLFDDLRSGYVLLLAAGRQWAQYESIYSTRPTGRCFTPIGADFDRGTRFGFATTWTAGCHSSKSNTRNAADVRQKRALSCPSLRRN